MKLVIEEVTDKQSHIDVFHLALLLRLHHQLRTNKFSHSSKRLFHYNESFEYGLYDYVQILTKRFSILSNDISLLHKRQNKILKTKKKKIMLAQMATCDMENIFDLENL